MYYFSANEKRWRRHGEFNCKRPLKIDFDDEHLFFGDYVTNRRRDKSIGVYRYSFAEGRLIRIYTFHDIRHVHGVKIVPGGRVVVMCGDYGREARIVTLSLDGDVLDEIVEGDQLIRAVDCYYRDGTIYYGTDTQLGQNYLCRVCLESKEVQQVREIEGPVFNVLGVDSSLIVFTVSCELGLENRRDISLFAYDLATDELKRLHRYEIPIRLNRLLQGLFGIPTFDINCFNGSVLVTNRFYMNCFRSQRTVQLSQ